MSVPVPSTHPPLKSLRVEEDGSVVEVTLTGPGRGNAMGPDFWREMPELFSRIDRDENIRAVIITGSGEHFSYGLDLKAMFADMGPHMTGDNLAASRTRFLDLVGDFQQACDKVAVCRKPVIAALSGWCIGGGLDLVSACDIRLCSSDARFSLRETRMAMVADIGSLQRLPHIIGQGFTRELAFSGRDFDAQRAREIGLVNDVLASRDALLAAARKMAREIADNPPLVVQGVKQVLNYCMDKPVADGLRYVAVWNAAFLQSLDLAEALAAFSEKRPPKFKGQ